MNTRLLVASLVAGWAVLPACSGGHDHEDTSNAGFPTTACASDTRKDIFTAGLTKPAGTLSVKMMEASPSPPSKGTNAMTIQVLDAAGAPVDGATITVTPFMPDHGHGSAVKPVVSALGEGRYAIAKVYLAMAGLWRVTVSVQPAGAPIQEAAFQFCLDG